MIQLSSKSEDNRTSWWIFLALSLIVTLPFAANSFTSDDWDLLWKVSSGGPFAIWTHHPSNFFRPLISLSLWCNFGLGTWHSWAYYIPNFLLHAANSALVFLIAGTFLDRNPGLGKATKTSTAALAALIFMTAPIHAEAIFFMSCRTDFLASLFGLTSILVFLTALDRKSLSLGLGAVGLLTIGYFCKESVYLIFAFFLLMGWMDRADMNRSRIAWISGSAALVLLAGTVAMRAQAVVAPLPHASPLQMLERMATMLVMPNVPIDVSIVTRRSIPHLTGLDWGVLALLIVLVGIVGRKVIRPSNEAFSPPDLRLPLIAFACAAVPVCFLAMPPFALEGGRLTYLPSAFSAIVFAFIVGPYLSRPSVKVGALTIVLVGVIFTYLSGTLYRDAGHVCDVTIDWFRTHELGSAATIVVVPDSSAGRFIWRNGIPGALSAFAPDWNARPGVVVPYTRPVPDMLGLKNFDVRTIKSSEIQRFGPESQSVSFPDATVVVFDGRGFTRSDHVNVILGTN